MTKTELNTLFRDQIAKYYQVQGYTVTSTDVTVALFTDVPILVTAGKAYDLYEVMYKTAVATGQIFEDIVQYTKISADANSYNVFLNHGQTNLIFGTTNGNKLEPAIKHELKYTYWEKLMTLVNSLGFFTDHTYQGLGDRGYYNYQNGESQYPKAWIEVKATNKTTGVRCNCLVSITDWTQATWTGSYKELS